MSYQPVQPTKTWLMAQVVPYGPVFTIRSVSMIDQMVEQVPQYLRVSIVAALLAWKYICCSDSPAEAISRLGWPEDLEFDIDEFVSKETHSKVENTLEHLKAIWPFESQQAHARIVDLESSLMCMVEYPFTQVAGAFCPKGSRGFARSVEMAGVDNPRSIPVEKKVSPMSILESILGGRLNAKVIDLGAGFGNTIPPGRKDIEFPES